MFEILHMSFLRHSSGITSTTWGFDPNTFARLNGNAVFCAKIHLSCVSTQEDIASPRSRLGPAKCVWGKYPALGKDGHFHAVEEAQFADQTVAAMPLPCPPEPWRRAKVVTITG